ncbi:non-specific serine/threonine protein kinase [Trifolium repens]|nr:non-specific serine/threonine protein kinase [Trifolium repens]
MKKPPSSSSLNTHFTAVTVIIIFYLSSSSNALGSGTTLSVTDSPATVCGITSGQSIQTIQCYRQGKIFPILPNVSFSSISGGRSYFCGLRSGNYSLHCWDISSSFQSKRLYVNDSVLLENLSVGDSHVCATVVGTGTVRCWRTNDDFEPSGSDRFGSISSGSNFSCGILKNGSKVRCWGEKVIAERLQNEFGNISMLSIVAGGSHVCGLNSTGFLVCKGSNSSGQIDVPQGGAFEYGDLALGDEHGCAIRRKNGSVVCWGGKGKFLVNFIESVSFELIVSASNFTCGLTTTNFSVICWGPGWSNGSNGSESDVSLSRILPGPCVQSSCSECGIYPDSQSLCSSTSHHICKPNICNTQITSPPTQPPSVQPPPPPPPVSPSRSKTLTRGLLIFAIVGSVGGFIGICAIIYCLWTGVCFGKKKVHNSVQPTVTRGSSSGSNTSSSSIKSVIMRQGSRIMRRQRSGPSSTKHQERAEEFSLSELIAATNHFSLQNKIGAGSFGIVYRGKLFDGRDVAIKRGETGLKVKKFQEKESAFESELAFLSRLHHKHLVRLVGYCEEKDERLLVYEYMKNGSLHSHLHDKNNVEKSSSLLNSWNMRIKIALDASRGIEYLHNYAVPSIIHRDIKSSNILLDATWTARVSDFGLSLMSPESDINYKPTKTAGTVGYIDPEYYGLNVLTAKSDVYGLGVVLLELLTGKRAIFRNDEDEGNPSSLVDFAVPAILAGELVKILDSRVGLPEAESNESEAVELMAYTAVHCVNLEGKDRPTMADIVANLERALLICEGGSINEIESISSVTISIVSD